MTTFRVRLRDDAPMASSSTTKLTFAILVAVSSLVGLGVTYWVVHELDMGGHRMMAVRLLSARVRPAWGELVSDFEANLPRNPLPMPVGDPAALLRQIKRSSLVLRAFYVTPAQLMTVYPSSWTASERQIKGPSIIDLVAWKPYPEDFKRLSPDFIQFTRRTVKRWRSSIKTPISIQDRRGHHLMIQGSHETGWLGYELHVSKVWEMGENVIARLGLEQFASFYFPDIPHGSWHVPVPPDRVPAGFPMIELTLNSTAIREIESQVDTTGTLTGLLLLGLFMLATIDSVRYFRNLLGDLAMAHSQSNFVSGISHEMRLPLTTIKMYSEMLRQGVVTELDKRNDYLDTITRESDRLSRLIENVLDFSRISRNKREYQFEKLLVADLVREAVTAMQWPLVRSRVAVEVVIPPLLQLKGDREALVGALVNLVSNAIKYAPGERVVLVSAAELRGEVIIEVRDFGPGIARNDQRKVLQPFCRLGNELTRSAPGSGLGLALVKAYAEGHHGKVEVESEAGQGTAFRLVLPSGRA